MARNGSENPPCLLSKGCLEQFPRGNSGLSVNMTALLRLVLRLIKSGATTPLRHTLLWPCAKGQVYCRGCHTAIAACFYAIRPVFPFMNFYNSFSVTISWLRKSRHPDTDIKHGLLSLSDAWFYYATGSNK